MLATVVLDAYRQVDAKEMAEALDEVCDPGGQSYFASCGIYGYWDYGTRELLYIGLASDFGQRFRQHNGLVKCKPESCKVREIAEYFGTHDKVGFSIMAASPNDQMAVGRNRRRPGIRYAEHDDYFRELIRKYEGGAIDLFLQLEDKLPRWNKTGGAIAGREAARLAESGDPEVLDLFEAAYGIKPFGSSGEAVISLLTGTALGSQLGAFIARASVREIAAEKEGYGSFEKYILHTARMHMKMDGIGLDAAIARVLELDAAGLYACFWDLMQKSGYLARQPQV